MKDIYIYLENGTYLTAKSFGAEGTLVGELVFNTSLTGYQEIITDPSYAGQFVTFTMPEIGNVGVNDNDSESSSNMNEKFPTWARPPTSKTKSPAKVNVAAVSDEIKTQVSPSQPQQIQTQTPSLPLSASSSTFY